MLIIPALGKEEGAEIQGYPRLHLRQPGIHDTASQVGWGVGKMGRCQGNPVPGVHFQLEAPGRK